MANNYYDAAAKSGYNPFMGAGVGGVLGGLGSMFGGSNPMNKATPYMNNASNDVKDYYKQAIGYLNPYMQGGESGLQNYQKMLGEYSNPSELYDHLMSGFKMSPSQQFAQQQGLDAVSNNAAMRGFNGSGPEAKALESYAQNSTSNAQQDYLKQMLGMYGDALGGYQDMSHMGMGAAGQAGQFGMDTGKTLAQLQEEMAKAAAAQQQQKNNDTSGLFGDLGSLIGGFWG